jgi:sugar O-acyltransferase (sialic acid O-acetyltransferase NeuD family)
MKVGILGASGHGKVVADLIEQLGHEIVFFDDAWPNKQILSARYSIVGNTDTLIEYLTLSKVDDFVIAIGVNAIRFNKQRQLQNFATSSAWIHPKAHVSPHASLGKGTVVMAGVIVQADAVIGDACIINTSASVDHDVIVGNGVHVAPNACLSGHIKVGDLAWIGVGACVKECLEIGNHSVIGAGAVVTKSVPPHVTVVGNPARILEKK